MQGVEHREAALALNRHSTAFLLGVCLLSAFLLRVDIAIRSPSIYFPDEIYQTLEPAHHLAYGYGVVTWEFREGARSWVFPAFLAGVMRSTDWMGSGSDGYLLGIVFVMSLISLTTVWFAFEWGLRTAGINAAVVAGLACAFWYELVYFAPKTFNEFLAGHLLLPGIYLGTYGWGRNAGRKRSLFLAGLFCGLAVALRVHLAPAILFSVVYFCRDDWKRKLPLVTSGVLLSIMVFGLVDACTWSYPFQSYIVNISYNVINGQTAALHGTWPWYGYLTSLVLHSGPLPLLALVGARRAPFLGWMALAILIPHSLIAHKEYRYIYPLLPVMITLAAIGASNMVTALNARLKRPRSPFVTTGLCVVFFLGTSAAIASIFPLWGKHAGDLLVFRQLSHDPAVCGVAVTGDIWTAGYSYLHKNIDIYLPSQETEVEKLSPHFNAIVAVNPSLKQPEGFYLIKCWNSLGNKGNGIRLLPMRVCLYKRKGACSGGDVAYQVNEVLKRRRE